MGRWTSVLRLVITSVGLLLFSLWSPARLDAAGSEFVGQQDDFVVTVDARWAGCTQGGYYPIRVRVLNRGETRDLQLSFQPNDKGIPSASRSVSVAQNATVVTSLLVPMVGFQSHGTFSASHRGRKLDQLNTMLSLADIEMSGAHPGLLVISPDNVDCTQFEVMCTSIYGGAAGRGMYGRSVSENHIVLPASALPHTSLAYSGLDIVAVTRPVFEGLRAEIREALLDWGQTGGMLLVYGVGANVTTDVEFAKLMGLDRMARQTPWIIPAANKRQAIPLMRTDEHGSQVNWNESNPKFAFSTDEGAIAAKLYGLGRIVGMRDNPFPGTAHDWAWLMRGVTQDQDALWPKRHGLNARVENRDFMQFMIPGISSVPTYSFVTFITLFAVLIGPVNYLLLSRRQKINWLIVTVPALAVVTTVCLFVYAAVSHGFTVKSRLRSLTVLDQGSQKAISTTRMALYAGMAPSEGMKFSTDTAVYPVWPTGNEFEQGHVDWSENQHLTSGWLRSRTKTQFVTVAPRNERGRLNVEAAKDDQVAVTNGFEWKLEYLLVNVDDKNVFYGRDIAAGAPAVLKQAATADLDEFRDQISDARLEFPEDYDRDRVFTSWSSNRYRYGYYQSPDIYSVAQGNMEQAIARLAEFKTRSQLGPRTYVAIVKEVPSLDLGTKVEVVDGWHVIVGYY